jgi:menaquinone-dependent protoporphyrinogen oxidase
MSDRVLIVYGTGHGQTERIVRRIGEHLSATGALVSIHRADRLPPGLDPEAFDGVVVGASIQYGRHQGYVRRFVRRHVARLNAVPTAFVSVSGAAAGTTPDDVRQVQGFIDTFLRQTGWRPTIAAPIAGAIAWSQYGPLVRWIFRMVARRSGRPEAELTTDQELTDWTAVERLASDFARALAAPTAVAPAAPAAR